MKYYLIAGEASGDLHGSNLMRGLLKSDPAARFRFWGRRPHGRSAPFPGDGAGAVRPRPVFSASQIETYHQCRFRYFCRYAVGARERRPAEFDALEYGTLMHYLFEKIIGDRAHD